MDMMSLFLLGGTVMHTQLSVRERLQKRVVDMLLRHVYFQHYCTTLKYVS